MTIAGRKFDRKFAKAANGEQKKMQPSEHKSCEVFYKINTPYEITLNPCDSFQHVGEMHRLKEVYNDCKKILKKAFGRNAQYLFYLEISEPKYSNAYGSFPRIHLHGTITFLDVESLGSFLLEGFNYLMDVFSIQLNEYRGDHWPAYITKFQHIMKPLLHAYELEPVITNYKKKKKKRKL